MMHSIAIENNYSETAFVVKTGRRLKRFLLICDNLPKLSGIVPTMNTYVLAVNFPMHNVKLIDSQCVTESVVDKWYAKPVKNCYQTV